MALGLMHVFGWHKKGSNERLPNDYTGINNVSSLKDIINPAQSFDVLEMKLQIYWLWNLMNDIQYL